MILVGLSFAALPASARDPVADEFNTLAAQIQTPPSAAWLGHAYSTNYMPKAGERDGVDVVLRRTTTLLNEFNQNGLLDNLATNVAALQQENATVSVSSPSDRLELFRRVSDVSRRVAFANPRLNFRDIVFLKRHQANYDHMVDQYFGFHAVVGGGIFILQHAFSGHPILFDVLTNAVCENGRFQGRKLNFGSFLSPSLSYDGKTIYFSHTEASGPTYQWTEHSTFHVFRVGVDGTGLRQLTDGPVNDLFPYPLPNGRLVFVSERRGGFGRCHARLCPTYTLYTMNADGTDITMLSAHETNEWHPWVDNDGMIIYTRWDYVDRGADQAHHPWITYPDGRDARSLQGNWKAAPADSPYMEMDVRSIPGSRKYVTTAAAHHGQSYGSFVLIDPRVADDAKMAPLKVLTPEAQFPEATTSATADWKFATAWALSERFYLCGYDPAGNNHALTLLDAVTGLKTTIYHDAAIACTYPIPLSTRPIPPLIPHRVSSGLPLAPGVTFNPAVYTNLPTTGTVALMNVYDSTLAFPTGTVIKYLRVLEVLAKTTPDHITPHMGYAQEKPGRRVLGTVPVESDGSAYFTLPADTPVFFQALDAKLEAVQSMRSLTYLKPGEALVCAGCHEPKGQTPGMHVQPVAVQRPPSPITPEVAGSNPFSYPRLVQPVLDANCVACHRAQRALDLSAGNYTTNASYWYNSYLNLASYAFYYGAYANDGYDRWNTPLSIPGQVGAKGSRLYQLLMVTNHHDLQLSQEARHRLTLWLDSNSDFYGAFENTLAQAQGQIVNPINPKITGYRTVTNTVYGPAIPIGTVHPIHNNRGLSQFGTPLEVASPSAPGLSSQPITLGQQAEAGLPTPAVDAGRDVLAYVTGPLATLSGTVTIQGQPPVPGTVLAWWSQAAGPTNVTIGNPSSLTTTVSFLQPGSYLLRLFASTGVTTNSDDLVITVLPANQPPLVDAGPDRVLVNGETNTLLSGTVRDDSGNTTAIWSQLSGPGVVSFDTPAAPRCLARFSLPGTYVLRLSANDGIASASDDCSLKVVVPRTNNPPAVATGNDIYTSYTNNPIMLRGTVTDDNVPGPVTSVWTVVSGPGSVTFSNAYSPSTTAYFSKYGYYVLQLTAADGERTAYDLLGVYLYPGDGMLPFGAITREYWGNLTGTVVSALTSSSNYPSRPDTTTRLSSFQVANNSGDNYGSRIHGFLFPPVSGNYTFWVASDDNAELWLSTNATPTGARLIASVSGWTDPLQWTKFASQKSAVIALQAGQAYYIKALQKEGNGGDHVAVAWQGPGLAQSVIDGYYLAPYPVTLPVRGTITRAYWTNLTGSTVLNLTRSPNYPNNPSVTQTLTNFEGAANWSDNYGSRIQGLLYPPTNGTYTFWIASDDNGELWLSTNANPNNARLIASVPVWTGSREWTKYASQQSASVTLSSNQGCYIMALQKEGGGGDNLAVAWQGPGISRAVIPGTYLSDYVDTGVFFPPTSGGPVVLARNAAPAISAGSAQEVDFENHRVSLRGQVFDDGLPVTPGSPTVAWSQVGGPGTVTFSDPSSPFTYASFSLPGLYLLRLSASDGELSGSDTVAVTLKDYREYDFFYPSPQEVAFSPDSNTVAVADTGLNRVTLLDRSTRGILYSVPLDGTPRGVTWESPNSLWVCEYNAGTVAKIDLAQRKVTRRVKVGLKPYDVKVDNSRQRLVVSDYGGDKVWVIDLVSGQTVASIPVVSKPMYVALTPNQALALVGNSEPRGDARDPVHAAALTLINLLNLTATNLSLPPGSTALRGLAVSPDGHWAYVAHLLSRTYLPTTQLNNGWILNNVVSIIDLTTFQVYATVPLDAFEEGFANPWGIALSDNGKTLWVCGSGVHEVIRLDLTPLHSYLAADPQHRAAGDSDLIALYQNGWLRRQALGAKGPRGISLSPDGHTLAVAAYFSGEVRLFDTTSAQANLAIAIGRIGPEHALRRGERLYYDGDGCFQRWLSCSSCHPGARSDGLNWDLINDGIGNAKNTLSHVFSTATPPSMSTGVRPSVAAAIQAGFKYIQFQQRSDQEMQDVFDFMASLQPEPSPNWNRGWLTAAAVRGQALFQNPTIGCANCHSGPYLTDQQRHNVGTGHPADVGPLDPIYDTPTLYELWRTAPYLHDGSAATLRDVLTSLNSNNLHGVTTQLASNQLDDLVAYLQQVGGATGWTNQPPLIYAGPPQLLTMPTATAQLSAMAQDEGLPASLLTLAWSQQSGPAPVTFGDTNLATTTATFAAPGEYALACRATDGDLTTVSTLFVTVRPSGSVADSDGNGLADVWEVHYFGRLGAANGGPNEDYDSDGLSNLYEYLTGTAPTDLKSGFHLDISQANNQVVVRFPAPAAGTALTPGKRYFTLQSGVPNGGQITWSDLPGYVDILGSEQSVEWAGAKSDSVKFFRVRIRLAP